MQTRINNNLTPHLVVRYYRNLESPASILGRRLARPLATRLAEFKGRKAGETYGPAFFTDPIEISAPDADKAIFWTDHEFDFDHSGDHTGWYCDPFAHETIIGGAVELPEFRNVYFESYRQSDCDGQPVFLESFQAADFTGCADEYDASECRREAGVQVANWGDQTAEQVAKEEKEYQVKEQAEMMASEKLEKRKKLATEFRELLSDSREQDLFGKVCETVRNRLESIAEERQELFDEAESLKNNPWQICS